MYSLFYAVFSLRRIWDTLSLYFPYFQYTIQDIIWSLPRCLIWNHRYWKYAAACIRRQSRNR
jgi:hypothetical protein